MDAPNQILVISVEPGLYFPEIGGFRHSDTVLVTRDGYEFLARYPWDLRSMTVRSLRPLGALAGWAVRKAVRYRTRGVGPAESRPTKRGATWAH